MTTAITTTDFSREQIDTIKQTVAKGATDSQLALFLQVCKSRSLDPFTKQVYFTPQGIIVSIDGFRSIAERTGCYAPGPTRYEYDEQKSLVAAFVTVRKLVAGTWFDLEESAFYEEYRGGSPIWKKMPRVMLAKCAEARALRRAFSSELSGLYTQDEMDQAGAEAPVYAPPVVVNPAPAAPKAKVTVLPAEPQEPTHVGSGEYVAARNAIDNATTIDALKIVAKGIARVKDVLLEGEADALRAAYNAKRSSLEGA
jgi:phage recombination protein Bet